MATLTSSEIIDCASELAKEPYNPVLRLRFARLCRDVGELALARTHYEEVVAISPHLAIARVELSRVVSQLQPQLAPGQQHVLLFVSTKGVGHTNTDEMLASREFVVTPIAVQHWDLDTPLPAASVAFNAISDADACAPALDIASAIVALTPSLRVLNAPAFARLTGRVKNAARLRSIPGLLVPAVTLVSRRELLDKDAEDHLRKRGVAFPLLLRTPGKNNGEEIEKIERATDLAKAMEQLPGDSFLASTFVDTRESDGMIRKYRAMYVGGNLYPLHAARSKHWNVHYADADQSSDAAAEEERFLQDMGTVLNPRATQALHDLFRILQLDYAGVDFGRTQDGRVVLYEANATMTIYVPERFGPESIRRRAAETVVAASRRLVAGIR